MSVPDNVRVDIRVYAIPVSPDSVSDGMCFTLKGMRTIPNFGDDNWRDFVDRQLKSFEEIAEVGKCRPMTADEVTRYEAAHENDDTDEEEEY